jgi:putative zinc finger/helix-turn-helix YgiT family protein
MASLICPECKKDSLIEKRGEYETTYVDRNGHSQTLKVPDVTWLECTNCDEVILDDRAMATLEDARRKALGLLSPQEIRGFRTQLGKTQKAMSELLGIGEKTYCRWESGSYVQSEAFDRYLRLLIADEFAVQLLEELTKTKSSARDPDGIEGLRETFSYIEDIEMVAEQSTFFVDRFVRGELLVV